MTTRFLQGLLAGGIMLLVATLTTADEIFVRVDAPGEVAWVGQQVLVPVTVGLAEQPDGSPQFRLPDVPGSVLLMMPRPVYGRETRDGVDYTTWTYSLAMYPHRQGTHGVGPIVADARVPQGDGTWQRITAETRPFTLRARMPAAARNITMLVTARDFSVEESWQPDETALRVGDAITRTVTLRAPDILGIGFPPMQFEAPDSVAVYPKPPRVDDEVNRGEIMGQRTETVVYVCEREGTAQLPPLVIPWFNPETETMNRVELAGRTLRVASNPALAGEQGGAADAGGRAPWGYVPAIAVGLAAGVLFLLCAGPCKRVFVNTRARIAAFRAWQRAPLPELNPTVTSYNAEPRNGGG